MASSSSASASFSSSLGKRPAPGGDQSSLEEDIQRIYEQTIKTLTDDFKQKKRRLDKRHEKEKADKSQEYEPALHSLDALLAVATSPAERAKLQQARQLVQEALDQDLGVLEGAHAQEVQEKEGKYERIKAEKKKDHDTVIAGIRRLRTDTTGLSTPPTRPRLGHEEQSGEGSSEEDDDEGEESGESSSEEDDSEEGQETEEEREEGHHWMQEEEESEEGGGDDEEDEEGGAEEEDHHHQQQQMQGEEEEEEEEETQEQQQQQGQGQVAGSRRLDVTCSYGYTREDRMPVGRRSSQPIIAPDMTKRLCGYLALPQFSQMDAVYLSVKINDISLFTKTLLERFPHMKTLLLDGSGAYSRDLSMWHWSLPPIFGMIERLETLRELQFPLATIKCKSLFSHIPRVHTLHLASLGRLEEAGLKSMLANTHLPNIRVLTLVGFKRLNYSTVKCILLAFSEVKMLSLRYTYLKDEIVTLREPVMADNAFAGRPEGWFDRIAFDLDNQSLLRQRGIIKPGQPRWLKQDLFAYDDVTGEVKQSVGDLRKTYAYLKTRSSFPYDLS